MNAPMRLLIIGNRLGAFIVGNRRCPVARSAWVHEQQSKDQVTRRCM